MRARALLIAVIAAAALARGVPSLVSGEPFSTDVWPLYRGAEALVSTPGARVWDDSLFDGYNNHWPGVMLLASAHSLLTGLPVKAVFTYALTPALAVGIAVGLYAFLRRFFGPSPSAVGASLALLTPSYLVFTSSPLKEVMAYPILLTILSIAFRRGRIGGGGAAALATLSAGLAVTHHLAPLMLAGALLSTYYVRVVYRARGLSVGLLNGRALLVAAAAVSLSAGVYYLLYGGAALRLAPGPEDLGVYAAYAAFFYIGFLALTGLGRAPSALIASVVVAALAALVPGYVSAIPGVVVPASSVAWYVTPLALSLLVLVPGVRDVGVRCFAVGSGLFILLNAAFVVFGFPAMATVLHRFLNYAVFPLALLAAYWVAGGSRRRRALTYSAIFFVAASSAAVLAGVLGGWDASSYWLYRRGEVSGFSAVIGLAGNSSIAADNKVGYFAIPRAEVSPVPALKALFGGGGLGEGEVLLTYRGNGVLGFVAGLTFYDIRPIIGGGGLSRVFDNGDVVALAGGG